MHYLRAAAIPLAMVLISCGERSAKPPEPSSQLDLLESAQAIADLKKTDLPAPPLPDQIERVRRLDHRAIGFQTTILVLEVGSAALGEMSPGVGAEPIPVAKSALRQLLSASNSAGSSVRTLFEQRVTSQPMTVGATANLTQQSYVNNIVISPEGLPDPQISVLEWGISAAFRLDVAADGRFLVDSARMNMIELIATTRYTGGYRPGSSGTATGSDLAGLATAMVEEPTLLVRSPRWNSPVPLGLDQALALPMASGLIASVSQFRAHSSQINEQRMSTPSPITGRVIGFLIPQAGAIPAEQAVDVAQRVVGELSLPVRAFASQPTAMPAGATSLAEVLKQLSSTYQIRVRLDGSAKAANEDRITQDGAASDLVGHLADLLHQTGLFLQVQGNDLILAWPSPT
ncbi:hypothetical protein LBMAG53_33620 [Planctomycetota bacterium]|nr:hypothetical protein LBMAG53_33620 [Planctomycetota bacterium]